MSGRSSSVYSMFLTVLSVFTAMQVVVQGQTVTPVYVQSNDPVTLTCLADDQATTLTWTGPGGTSYVTGTTVDAGLDGTTVKPRISASRTGGSYSLTFTEFRYSDTGIYTCTVDGTVDLQMVIVQGVTSASPVYTRHGGNVTLQCPDTGGTAIWSVTSNLYIYTIGLQMNPDMPEDTRTRLSVTRQNGTYNLHISDVQLSDIREYRCTIVVTDTLYHLLLYIPPEFPDIENTVNVNGQNRTTGTEDRSMTLTCNARGGTPAASVSWIKDGANLVTSDNTVQYTKVFTRADDMTVYTCQSSSPALTSPQTTSVLVYLDLKPGQPTISDQSSQTENWNLQVVCVSTGSRPAADIEWNVEGTWQSNNPTEVLVKDSKTDTYNVTSALPVTRQDKGKSVYCRASNRALSGGTESVRRTLTLLYPPDIHVSYSNTTYTSTDRVLTCVPDGNPDTYQFGRWRHQAEDGTEIRQLTGSSDLTQSVLILPDAGVTKRYEDTGYYVCTVSNNIPVSSPYRSGSVFFVVAAPPIISTTAPVIVGRIGNNVTIEVEFYSRPEVSSNDVTWTRGSDGIPPPKGYVMHLDARSIQMSFHGVDVKVKGYAALLTIITLAEEDVGDYTVKIENSVGIGEHTVKLLGTGPPSPSLYLLQKQITSSSITIQWIPGTDGGQQQTFVIGYRSDGTADYSDADSITDTNDSVMSHTLEGLTINTLYSIRLYAQNDQGISDQITLNLSTNGNGERYEETCTAAVALITVSSILFCAVVVAMAVMFIVRRQKSPSCFQSNNNNPNGVNETNQQAEPGNIGSNDHDHSSKYDDLNLTNVGPASLYETISVKDDQNADTYVNTAI